jgi:vancomycin permeability regulator SanA
MKKKKKALWIAAAVLVLLGLLLGLGPNLLIAASARSRIFTPEEAASFGADCILVLGAGLLPDGSPSLMLGERIQTGVDLYKAGVSPKLLMSGDHSRADHDEVNAMKDAAMAQGVPSEDIFMDHAGFATYDSFYRAGAIFGVKKVVIVTQAYHLPRALWIARALGLEAVGVSCDTRRYAGQLYRDVREILARDKDFFKCIVRPLPRYLGEAIPIWGSGDATNDRG